MLIMHLLGQLHAGSLGTISDQDTGNHFTVQQQIQMAIQFLILETGGSNITGAGLSLNSSTGVISGDPTDVTSNTTISFTGKSNSRR